MKIKPYKTLKCYNEGELKENKSVFLARAYPVSNENEVNDILKDLKKKYYDASHHCYAFRLLSGKIKYSDASEPSGTAGIRILNAIDHYELQDCLIAVIRYYGGTKLGVGPLGKAYYTAAIQAIPDSNMITKHPYIQMKITSPISSLDKLRRIITLNRIAVIETSYDCETQVKCLIPYDSVEKVEQQIKGIFKEEVVFSSKKEIFYK
jgi:putative IMPACT (imprinted ancient) family translation regulator